MHRAVCLSDWRTAQTPMHTPQDMLPEVSPQSRTDYGRHTVLHRAMTTWNYIPQQVTVMQAVQLDLKTDTKKTPYGTAGTVKQPKHRHRHMHTHTHTITYALYTHTWI